MLERVRAYMVRHGMVTAGQGVLVAVSGGPDSVALLDLLHRLSASLGVWLHVFHMDHGLRGDASRADAEYVEQLAEQLSLPCTVVSLARGELKEQPGSLQANARAVRYEAMDRVARQVGAAVLALGHNRDDQAETVLMRMLRGSGTKGLAGIAPVRRTSGLTYVRPLLDTARVEIEEYCHTRELFPRQDASNEAPAYLRNQIRLELLPHLATVYNPAVKENLAQIATVLRAEDDCLEELTNRAITRCRAPGEGVVLHGSVLLTEPLALARRVVRRAAREVMGTAFDLGLDAVTQVLDAAANSHGSRTFNLSGGLTVTVEYGVCRFMQALPEAELQGVWPVVPGGVTVIPELHLVVEEGSGGPVQGPFEAAFDADRLKGPLAVRLRRPGDRFWPAGMEGSKKLQDLLVDAKVPRSARGRIPLLVCGDDIVWVIGHRLDRRFLADRHTQNVRVFRATPWLPDEEE